METLGRLWDSCNAFLACSQNPPDLATDLNGVELPHLGWPYVWISVWILWDWSWKTDFLQTSRLWVSDFLSLNGIWESFFSELRKACFLDDSKGLHHIFVIGDWGGVSGSLGERKNGAGTLLKATRILGDLRPVVCTGSMNIDKLYIVYTMYTHTYMYVYIMWKFRVSGFSRHRCTPFACLESDALRSLTGMTGERALCIHQRQRITRCALPWTLRCLEKKLRIPEDWKKSSEHRSKWCCESRTSQENPGHWHCTQEGLCFACTQKGQGCEMRLDGFRSFYREFKRLLMGFQNLRHLTPVKRSCI